MVSIIVNHLQWYPSGFDWVAARGSLVVSAAEGFFLISGIVLGIVRGYKLRHQPFREAAFLLVKRGVILYATSIILTIAFTLIGWWFFMDQPGLKPGIRPLDEPLGDVLAGILSFRYLYGWADFLRLYAIFLFISPVALWLLRRNLWFVVLAGSIALWSLFPWAAEHIERRPEAFMILSWQLIFFAGLTIGYHWQQLSDWWRRHSLTLRRALLTPVLIVAATTLVANIVIEGAAVVGINLPAPLTSWYAEVQDDYFYKEELPAQRLIIFGLWFVLGFWIFHRFERPIKRAFGWILLPFGHNSLYVYILHAIILFFAHLIWPPEVAWHFWPNFFGTLLVVGLIYLAVRTRFLFRVIPR